MTGTSYGNVFDYFNTFSAVLDWWFSSKPECQKLSYLLVSRVLDLKDTATLQFTNLLQIWYFERKLKLENFCPGEVRVRQNDIEKIMGYQKCFIGPLVWKCFTNDFELLLSEN